MDAKISKYVLQARTFLVVLFLCLPNGVMWYWGNMSVYVMSYLHMTGVIQSVFESPWLLSAYDLCFSVSFMIAEAIALAIGRKLAITLGILMIDGGLFCSFFTIQHSIHIFNISQGVMPGIGGGLLYSLILQYTVDYSDKGVGLFIGLVGMSLTIGGAILTQIVSWYINPHNVTPKLQIGPITYFTQIDVIKRVPSVYLVLGSCALTTHLIGLALLKSKQKPLNKEQIKDLGTSSIENDSTQTGCPTDKDERSYLYSNEEDISKVSRSDCVRGKASSEADSETGKNVNKKNIRKYEKHIPSESLKTVEFRRTETNFLDLGDGACIPIPKGSDSEIVGDSNDKENTDMFSYTPREMFQHKAFYCLWILNLILTFEYLSLANYFKTFGELFIKNDHYLSKLGSTMGISVAFFRILSGALVDKLRMAWVMVFLTSGLSLTFTFYYFTPMVNQWLYYLLTILVSCGDSCLYSCMAVSTMRLFGPKHMSTNFGFVLSTTILVNLAAPPLYQLLLENLGWFSLFFSIGSLYFLGLLLTVLSVHNI